MKHPNCLCGHSRSVHRQAYGEPHTGKCADEISVTYRGLTGRVACPCVKYRTPESEAAAGREKWLKERIAPEYRAAHRRAMGA